MTKKFNPSRRSFGQLVGAGALGVAASPFIGGVRRAHAARGSAAACIRFYLSGGARTSVMWDANHSTKYNPYGQKDLSGVPGIDPSLSICNLWNDAMIGVMEHISVVRTVVHDAGTSHAACQQRILTGGTDANLPGWATVANREVFSPLPAVHIGDNNPYAEQLGSLGGTYSSIEIPNARSVEQIKNTFLAGLPTEQESKRIARLRDSLSKRSIQRTAHAGVRDLPFQQNFAVDIIEQLTSGATFDITSNGDGGSLGQRISDDSAITNGQLRPIFGVSANGQGNRYGAGAMLGMRLVQAGVRSVTVENGGWDSHGGEQANLTGKLNELGQAIAGLINTLRSMKTLVPGSGHTSALDDVLIVVDTEFNRDNTGNNGFNGGGGSDHQSTYARRLAVMFAGGGVAGGRGIGATDANFEAVDGVTYHSSRVNSTIFDLLGINYQKYLPNSRPIEEMYT